jgi:murein DD-endopeptidase MepM/ murein hydrolase activator NlpD
MRFLIGLLFVLTSLVAFADFDNDVHLEREKTKLGDRWYVRNDLYAPIRVRLVEKVNRNASTTPKDGAVMVVGPRQRAMLVDVHYLSRGARYEFEYRFSLGDPSAKHAEHVYQMPLPAKGKPIRIMQGFGGSFSHFRRNSYHALDFDVPIGTPVFAARGGIVVQAIGEFRTSCEVFKQCGDAANLVRILHADGSFAVYVHLDRVSVRVGQRVTTATQLGLSGNTGFSTAPHLHFAVQLNRQGKQWSVPFQMRFGDGWTGVPQQGQRVVGRER